MRPLLLILVPLLALAAWAPAAAASHPCTQYDPCCDHAYRCPPPPQVPLPSCHVREEFAYSDTGCNVLGIQVNNTVEYCPDFYPWLACASTLLVECWIEFPGGRCTTFLPWVEPQS